MQQVKENSFFMHTSKLCGEVSMTNYLPAAMKLGRFCIWDFAKNAWLSLNQVGPTPDHAATWIISYIAVFFFVLFCLLVFGREVNKIFQHSNTSSCILAVDSLCLFCLNKNSTNFSFFFSLFLENHSHHFIHPETKHNNYIIVLANITKKSDENLICNIRTTLKNVHLEDWEQLKLTIFYIDQKILIISQNQISSA